MKATQTNCQHQMHLKSQVSTKLIFTSFVASAIFSASSLFILQAVVPAPAIATSSQLFEQGCTLMQRKNFRAAAGVFTEAVSNSPQDVNAVFRRGQCFYCMNDPQQAIADFDRALSLQENDQIYLWRGSANSKLGNNPKAIEDYVKAMRLNPELVTAMQNRNSDASAASTASPAALAAAANPVGMTKAGTHKEDTVNLGNSDQAIKNYEEAFHQVINQASDGYFLPGTTFGGIWVPQAGEQAAKVLYKPTKDSSEIIKKDGVDYLTLKDARKSCTQHTHEIDTSQNDSDAWFMRGRDNEQLNLLDRSLEDFTHAIELQPLKPIYLLGRAFYYHKHGNDDAAALDIAKAKSLDPSLPKTITYEPKLVDKKENK